MQTIPDGIEITATHADARGLDLPPLLVLEPVIEFMDARGLGSGPLSWARIGDGQSNITYRIDRGSDVFVLRRGPRPPLPKSTHDMVREARIQQLLGRHYVPVPEILAVCEDHSVLGVPFYIMSFMEGVVITDTVPAHLDSSAQRAAASAAAVDTLIQLHQIPADAGELATIGRPEGYLRRQVERFSTLWDVNTTRTLPDVPRIGAWLEQNIPASQATAVIHGDFRLGNLMFSRDEPARVTGILDWEMATLGDPLTDLGYLTATYAEPGSVPTPLELTPVTGEPGFLDRAQLIARYRDRMDLDLEALPWYQTLALWKASIFCEAIYTRWLHGERPEDTVFGPSLKTGVPQLLLAAGQFAGTSRG
ncbi:aminoglycoside phosphotransferase (APT) family kinase protein [Arthrobacter ginsengisoli]|uniref:Aminoglycoside phosphotransferase (APT) family kinase protein n=1 Tax=Arthrobacter ginsengisoli TaxID=1356565 RepID=A0ABU1UHP8_9MICC|nr:phosphotransferase family protein [Arthrobacter ginsengisoli]MDR7084723.1 aminoglycoside phosphotransferase (APT) family kinase protein [Arthrobacter ginsengisoli]